MLMEFIYFFTGERVSININKYNIFHLFEKHVIIVQIFDLNLVILSVITKNIIIASIN